MISDNSLGRHSLLRAWIRIHSTGLATSELVLVACLSVFVFGHGFSRLGPVSLPSVVLSSLVLPLMTGVAVATAAVNAVHLDLPDPWRVRRARLGWCAMWLGMAAASAGSGLLVRAPSSELLLPTIRNVLVYSAISLPLATERKGSLIWLPAVLLTLAAAVFGFADNRDQWYWWAVVLDAQVTGHQLVAASFLMLLAAAHYTFRDPAGRRTTL